MQYIYLTCHIKICYNVIIIIGGAPLKRKRLDRRGWIGLKQTEYTQAVIKCDGFNGILGLLDIREVTEPTYWGDILAVDVGMKWLLVLPFDGNYVVTAMISVDGVIVNWYIDIIGGYGYLPDGVAWFDDLYLDFDMLPDGRYDFLDMDELDDALLLDIIDKTLYDTAVNAAKYLESSVLNDVTKFNT